MLHNIPRELQALPQWVAVRGDKVPIDPHTGLPASVTDPSTWGSLQHALAASGGHGPVGFVFTEADPYTGIDLDNKPERPLTEAEWRTHEKILSLFQTYQERSYSGHGYHVICRGRLPVAGFRRGSVEVYSSGRYFIFTGNVVNHYPITDSQYLLDALYQEHAAREQQDVPLVDADETDNDRAVYDRAAGARNGQKFITLWNGHWPSLGYGSQSEADDALVQLLCFYTQSNEQVRRLFRMSGLNRAKANDRYLNYSIKRFRSEQAPPINFDEYIAAHAQRVQQAQLPEVPTLAVPLEGGDQAPPPGLVGEIARYFYGSMYRQVSDIALVAALGFMAGLCGKAYNVSGTGLNVYLVLVARTGVGKSGLEGSVNRLLSYVRQQVPGVDRFLGPSSFGSAQGLLRRLEEHPCFVSMLGEFGLWLKKLQNERDDVSQQVKRVVLDLYQRSGRDGVLRETAYSDKTKNTKVLFGPSLSIVGETTPENFYDSLDSQAIADGFLPRFSVVEYTGMTPKRNRAADAPPSQQLVDRVAELSACCLATMANNTVGVVSIEPAAQVLFDEYEDEIHTVMNNQDATAIELQLYNRAHQKALRLAALLAVGCNWHAPVVDVACCEWALHFVRKEVSAMLTRFTSGSAGANNESRQEFDLVGVVNGYLTQSHAVVTKVSTVPEAMHKEGVVPFDYLRRRCKRMASFYRDRRGSKSALSAVLDELVAADVLAQVPDEQVRERYQRRGRCYVVGQNWRSKLGAQP